MNSQVSFQMSHGHPQEQEKDQLPCAMSQWGLGYFTCHSGGPGDLGQCSGLLRIWAGEKQEGGSYLHGCGGQVSLATLSVKVAASSLAGLQTMSVAPAGKCFPGTRGSWLACPALSQPGFWEGRRELLMLARLSLGPAPRGGTWHTCEPQPARGHPSGPHGSSPSCTSDPSSAIS